MSEDLTGKIFFVTGKIPGTTHHEIYELLRSRGAVLTDLLDAHVDIVAHGPVHSARKLDRARVLGCRVIDADRLESLIGLGPELPDEEPAELADSVAELRSKLDGASHEEAWSAIADALDTSNPEDLGNLFAYVQGYASRLQPDPVERWREYTFNGRNLVSTFGEPCVMPAAWVGALTRDEPAPQAVLARAMTLAALRLSSSALTKLFEREELGELRALDLGNPSNTNRLRKTFFEAMASATNLTSLESLAMHPGYNGADSALADAAWLEQIRHLPVHGRDSGGLFELPAFARVDTPIVSFPRQLANLARPEVTLTGLRRLVLVRSEHWYMNELLDAMEGPLPEVLRDIEEFVAVRCTHEELSSVCTWLGPGTQQRKLKRLDLFATREQGQVTGDAGVALYRDLLERTGLAESIDEIIVADHVMEDVREAIRAMGVDVPQGAEASDAAAPATPPPATREQPSRRDEGIVHVADALQWRDPGPLAMDVVSSVALGLQSTLDEGAFRAAIAQIASGLEHWPDHIRVVHEAWLGELRGDSSMPAMELFRTLELNQHLLANGGPKNIARWLSRLAEEGALEGLTHLGLENLDKGKLVGQAAIALAQAMPDAPVRYSKEPTGYNIKPNKELLSFLEAEGRLETPDLQGVVTPTYSVAEALRHTHAPLRMNTPEDVEEFAQARDLDHVRALEISVHRDARERLAELAATSAPLRLPNLVSLCLRRPDMMYSTPFESIASLCATARPVVFGDADAWYETWALLNPVIHDSGILTCAYGSSLALYGDISREDTERMLGSGRVRAWSLNVGDPDAARAPARENAMRPSVFAQALHEDTAGALRRLVWEVDDGDLEDLGALLAALPRLLSLIHISAPPRPY